MKEEEEEAFESLLDNVSFYDGNKGPKTKRYHFQVKASFDQ